MPTQTGVATPLSIHVNANKDTFKEIVKELNEHNTKGEGKRRTSKWIVEEFNARTKAAKDQELIVNRVGGYKTKFGLVEAREPKAVAESSQITTTAELLKVVKGACNKLALKARNNKKVEISYEVVIKLDDKPYTIEELVAETTKEADKKAAQDRIAELTKLMEAAKAKLAKL